MTLRDFHKPWGIIKNTHMKQWAYISWFHTFFLLELYSKLFRWLSLENMEFILLLDNIQRRPDR